MTLASEDSEPASAPWVPDRGRGNRTHGMSSTPTYKVWLTMRTRCYNPKHDSYPIYGGSGIRVFFGWLGRGGFQEFLKEVGERPGPLFDLDRIDPKKGYEPGNVRWLPRELNRATCHIDHVTKVRAKDPDGVERELSLYAWAEHLGMPYRSLCRRLQRGMKDAAFSTRRRW